MIMKVGIPKRAELLRRAIHLGQVISSHALSFFHLSSPDLLLGWDADPAIRNILGIAQKYPDLAKKGIRLRKFGQEISERITGKKVHSIGITAGGMNKALSEENRKALSAWIPEALETVKTGLDLFKQYRDTHREEVDTFANFETLYLGTVGPQGEHELYDGKLRFVNAAGEIIADQLQPEDYLSFIAERPLDWSYLKNPYYKPLGFPNGIYRVGPLARLNVSSSMRTPLAEKEFKEFKKMGNNHPVHGTFYYHYARLIEALSCVELVHETLNDDGIMSGEICSEAGRNQAEGIGCSEAPRGTLFHHYVTDEDGILKKVNLLIATGQNNPAMNRSVLEVAKQYVNGFDLKEGALNRVEAAIRCYDPCLSCSTHAIGSMPLIIEIQDCDGRVRNVVRRGA
jgi:NAD-reducing hydrogenase large subunit